MVCMARPRAPPPIPPECTELPLILPGTSRHTGYMEQVLQPHLVSVLAGAPAWPEQVPPSVPQVPRPEGTPGFGETWPARLTVCYSPSKVRPMITLPLLPLTRLPTMTRSH